MSATDEIKRLHDEVEARTGYRAFHYVSQPTPTQTRYVFGDAVLSSEGAALAKMHAIKLAVAEGEWDHWNCRACPWSFATEAERDAHEAAEKGRRHR